MASSFVRIEIGVRSNRKSAIRRAEQRAPKERFGQQEDQLGISGREIAGGQSRMDIGKTGHQSQWHSQHSRPCLLCVE